MNSKKKRRDDWRRDFSDFFALDEIDDEFERMKEYMDRVVHRLMESESEYEKPFVYGFSMRVGPDGKPQIRQFGNTKPWAVGREEEIGGREPLTDIIEGDKTISVTIEIPGVEKDDMKKPDYHMLHMLASTDIAKAKLIKMLKTKSFADIKITDMGIVDVN